MGELVACVAEATTCTGELTVVPDEGDVIVTPAKAAETLKRTRLVSCTAIRVLEHNPNLFNAHLGGK
jgi:hypothetical protein